MEFIKLVGEKIETSSKSSFYGRDKKNKTPVPSFFRIKFLLKDLKDLILSAKVQNNSNPEYD